MPFPKLSGGLGQGLKIQKDQSAHLSFWDRQALERPNLQERLLKRCVQMKMLCFESTCLNIWRITPHLALSVLLQYMSGIKKAGSCRKKFAVNLILSSCPFSLKK